MKLLSRSLVAVAALLMWPATQAGATTILGGSALLTPGYATQLETWLGEGPLTLTNIFTKGVGSTSYDFHAAADGKGRTFSVIEVVSSYNYYTGDPLPSPMIIGGYDPVSWDSQYYYNTSPPNNFDAFLFNLTDSFIQTQTGSAPYYQTYNGFAYGPTFGGGHDLYVGTDLTSGYTYPYSYSPYYGANLLNHYDPTAPYQYDVMTIGHLEVFTISADNSPVPEPSTIALMGAGPLGARGAEGPRLGRETDPRATDRSRTTLGFQARGASTTCGDALPSAVRHAPVASRI